MYRSLFPFHQPRATPRKIKAASLVAVKEQWEEKKKKENKNNWKTYSSAQYSARRANEKKAKKDKKICM